jgi:hypothetical protein
VHHDDVEPVGRGLGGGQGGVPAAGGLQHVQLELAGQRLGDDVPPTGCRGGGVGVDDEQRAHGGTLTGGPILASVSTRQTGPPWQIRAAGVTVGVEGLLGVGFAVLLALRAADSPAGVGAVLGEAGYFLVIGAGVVFVAVGLLTGRRWARTPAIVAQLLLLPVVYSLIGPSHQLLLGIVSGIVVIATFLLLISEPSREWSVGLDLPVDSGRDPTRDDPSG